MQLNNSNSEVNCYHELGSVHIETLRRPNESVFTSICPGANPSASQEMEHSAAIQSQSNIRRNFTGLARQVRRLSDQLHLRFFLRLTLILT